MWHDLHWTSLASSLMFSRVHLCLLYFSSPDVIVSKMPSPTLLFLINLLINSCVTDHKKLVWSHTRVYLNLDVCHGPSYWTSPQLVCSSVPRWWEHLHHRVNMRVLWDDLHKVWSSFWHAPPSFLYHSILIGDVRERKKSLLLCISVDLTARFLHTVNAFDNSLSVSLRVQTLESECQIVSSCDLLGVWPV